MLRRSCKLRGPGLGHKFFPVLLFNSNIVIFVQMKGGKRVEASYLAPTCSKFDIFIFFQIKGRLLHNLWLRGVLRPFPVIPETAHVKLIDPATCCDFFGLLRSGQAFLPLARRANGSLRPQGEPCVMPRRSARRTAKVTKFYPCF